MPCGWGPYPVLRGVLRKQLIERSRPSHFVVLRGSITSALRSTARLSPCLRLTHVATSKRPRLGPGCGGAAFPRRLSPRYGKRLVAHSIILHVPLLKFTCFSVRQVKNRQHNHMKLCPLTLTALFYQLRTEGKHGIIKIAFPGGCK